MTESLNLTMNKPENLMNMAYEVLKNAICSNKIKPGSLLSETQIACELGMSRTPVREALKMLAIEGYVEIRTGIGAYVQSISYKEAVDIYEVRGAIEILAAKTAIYNITEKDVEILKKRFNSLLAKNKNNEQIGVDEFVEIDLRLHELLVERCDNQFAQAIMEKIIDRVKRVQTMSFNALNDIEESTNQHLHLLELIKNKNYEELAVALDDHIKWSTNCLKVF